MSAEENLYAALAGSAPVTVLAGDRIYPDLIPAEVDVPCIGFSRQGTEFVNTLHGTTAAARVSFEVWCIAERREAADALAQTVSAGIQAAGFTTIGRRAEAEGESSESFEATVLTVDYWEC